MDQDEANIDPYLHLGLTPAATEKDIKSAYRKKSLGVHPDRNPDNPQAAHQFHLLTVSQALLLDGPKRAILDVKLEAAAKRAERTAGLESRKRGMVNDLVAREEAFKKAKSSATSSSSASTAQEASVQSAGRKLREEAAAAALAADDFARSEEKRINKLASKSQSNSSNRSSSTITDLDVTLRLSLPLPIFSHLVSEPGALEKFLLAKYGKVDTVVLREGKVKKSSSSSSKAGKEQATAMVVFEQSNLGGCWALWEDCRSGRGGWEGVKAKWGNKGVEPEWVGRLGRAKESAAASSTTTTAEPSLESTGFTGFGGGSRSSNGGVPSFSFDPTSATGGGGPSTAPPPPPENYESSTLLRMRQAERERLEREIREEEMEDGE
ncbi:hypothetical protein BDY24DRAFT_396725 [Mrakia frigida]|uniref:J domain-containing protein n=1 Tax=Mrakia frigida TaxID=29902 RepID=UPI003FCC26ED